MGTLNQNDRRRLAELCGYELSYDDVGISGMFLHSTYQMNFNRDWHPDESIEQAMMVAEAMKSRNAWLSLNFMASCTRSYFHVADDREYVWADADTPAEAICAAALAALDAERLPKGNTGR